MILIVTMYRLDLSVYSSINFAVASGGVGNWKKPGCPINPCYRGIQTTDKFGG